MNDDCDEEPYTNIIKMKRSTSGIQFILQQERLLLEAKGGIIYDDDKLEKDKYILGKYF